MTWIAAGSYAAATRILRSETCPLMWLAPSWHGTPASRHARATTSVIRSYSSSSRQWNSLAVPFV